MYMYTYMHQTRSRDRDVHRRIFYRKIAAYTVARTLSFRTATGYLEERTRRGEEARRLHRHCGGECLRDWTIVVERQRCNRGHRSMFPARLLKTLRSHVYDTRAAAIIPHRGKGVRLLFPVCPREYATGAALFRQIRNDTLFFSLSLFFSFYQRSTLGWDPRDRVFGKISRSLGGSVPRPRDVENELIFGFAVERSNRDIESKEGELWRRYVKESRGGYCPLNIVKIEEIFFICVSIDYESINLYLLGCVLEAFKI